jgi:POT family proton-dependent oligopeptide transporter
MGVLALGGGLFVPSLPSQVRDLYSADDPRRASAYYVYYFGINLGSLLAPLICGALGERVGWHWGFGAAGVGMLLGLGIYAWGARWLPHSAPLSAATRGRAEAVNLTPVWRLFGGVILAVIVFRGAYEQLGNTLALWARDGVDRGVGGFMIPMTWFQALNPFFVFTMTPFILVWRRRSSAAPDSPLASMATGALLVAGAYALLAAVTFHVGHAMVHWLWMVLALGLMTLGELFILPVGLSLFGRLAPPGLAATCIAAWFGAGFIGNLLAGALGTLWSRLAPAEFFVWMAAIAALAATLLAGLAKSGRRAPHGIVP